MFGGMNDMKQLSTIYPRPLCIDGPFCGKSTNDWLIPPQRIIMQSYDASFIVSVNKLLN